MDDSICTRMANCGAQGFDRKEIETWNMCDYAHIYIYILYIYIYLFIIYTYTYYSIWILAVIYIDDQLIEW